MTDYKALYEQQLEENKKLKKRLTHNTRTIMKLKKENKELVQEKHEIEINSVECHCDHCKMWLSYDDLNISLGVGHRCCEMCFEEKKLKDRDDIIKELKNELKDKGYTRDQETEEEEEEEVKEKIWKDICIHCDRKKKGPGDMFIIHQDCDGEKEEWCGECYMSVERYKLRSYP